MRIRIEKEEFKNMICYWIECRHVLFTLYDLIEDTDEIGELYEFNGWLKNNQRGDQISMMDVHRRIEKAGDLCYTLSDQITDILPTLLLEYGKMLYPKELGKAMDGIKETQFEEILDYLEDNFEEIYTYQSEAQFENFCRIFGEACEKIKSRKNSGSETIEALDEVQEWPFN